MLHIGTSTVRFIGEWTAQNLVENEVLSGLEASKGGALSKASLLLSVLKPLHAKWLITAIIELGGRAEIIRSGFRKAGILTDTSGSQADTEPPSPSPTSTPRSRPSTPCSQPSTPYSQRPSADYVSRSKVSVTYKTPITVDNIEAEVSAVMDKILDNISMWSLQ